MKLLPPPACKDMSLPSRQRALACTIGAKHNKPHPGSLLQHQPTSMCCNQPGTLLCRQHNDKPCQTPHKHHTHTHTHNNNNTPTQETTPTCTAGAHHAWPTACCSQSAQLRNRMCAAGEQDPSRPEITWHKVKAPVRPGALPYTGPTTHTRPFAPADRWPNHTTQQGAGGMSRSCFSPPVLPKHHQHHRATPQ